MSRPASVDPDELREFALKLKGFAQFLEEQFDGLSHSVDRLSESWRDQEYQSFLVHFQRTKERLRAFAAATDQAAPQMLRDAEAAAEIHRGSLGL